jgi:hypothetical protein
VHVSEKRAGRFIGVFDQDFGEIEVERRAPAGRGPGKINDRDRGTDKRRFRGRPGSALSPWPYRDSDDLPSVINFFFEDQAAADRFFGENI